MWLNGLEHLLRRKIVLAAGLAALAFLGFFWWGVSAAESAFERGEMTRWDREEEMMVSMLRPADAALGAIAAAAPLAAMLATSLAIIIGSSMLPEEVSRGRMPFWLSLPASRGRVFLGTALAPLTVSLLLSVLLFGGICLITRLHFAFTPRSLPLALLSMLCWLCAVWAAVTTLSLLVRKVASILIVFFLSGVASLFGGIQEVMKIIPDEAPGALVTITRVVMLLFPADRGFRGVLYGLMPTDAVVTENLAFFGVATEVPPLQLAYAAGWAGVVLLLGFIRFRRMDF